MPPSPSRLTVDEHELRRLFNDNHYWDKLRSGLFTQSIRKSKHLGVAIRQLPYCTHSQSVVYLDEAQQAVAIVHQYLQPDGTLGASGKPDPKMVRVGTVIYTLRAPQVSP